MTIYIVLSLTVVKILGNLIFRTGEIILGVRKE